MGIIAQLVFVWALGFGAVPGPPAVESLAVLLARPHGADVKADVAALVEGYNKLVPGGPAAFLLPKDKAGASFQLPGIGRVQVRVDDRPLAEAEAAFKRGITSLISDAVLAPHVAQLVVELTPEAGTARVAALEALTSLGIVACQRDASTAGVYFAAGRVLQPAPYVLGAARDKLPKGWLWVGFELGGNTSELTFTSIGLAKKGLLELQLTTARRDVGAAIETFFDLVALALARDQDFPDGHEFARKSGTPLVVRHGEVGGSQVWRVAYVPGKAP